MAARRALILQQRARLRCRPSPRKRREGKKGGGVGVDSSSASELPAAFDFVRHLHQKFGINLTMLERNLISEAAGGSQGRVSSAQWRRMVEEYSRDVQVKRAVSEIRKESTLRQGQGQKALTLVSSLGVCFFAVCGAHTAGEEGMHVTGAAMVGGITALGGGTLNQMMIGSLPVGWMRSPGLVATAVAASVASFYVWPVVELEVEARRREQRQRGQQRQQRQRQEEEEQKDRTATGAAGTLWWAHSLPSTAAVRYGLESVALACFSVVGAQSGIIHGLPAAVSVILGVTITLGGAFRDVLCQRSVSVIECPSGAQAYALASFVGSATYVALRELHVRLSNAAASAAASSSLAARGIPIGLRIATSAGAAVCFRVYAWQQQHGGQQQQQQQQQAQVDGAAPAMGKAGISIVHSSMAEIAAANHAALFGQEGEGGLLTTMK